ncbi:MAG: hypothetical protein AB8B85_20595 [Paracoccaceae bacterium]
MPISEIFKPFNDGSSDEPQGPDRSICWVMDFSEGLKKPYQFLEANATRFLSRTERGVHGQNEVLEGIELVSVNGDDPNSAANLDLYSRLDLNVSSLFSRRARASVVRILSQAMARLSSCSKQMAGSEPMIC